MGREATDLDKVFHRSTLRIAVAVLLVSACGRIGYELERDGAPVDSRGLGPADAPPDLTSRDLGSGAGAPDLAVTSFDTQTVLPAILQDGGFADRPGSPTDLLSPPPDTTPNASPDAAAGAPDQRFVAMDLAADLPIPTFNTPSDLADDRAVPSPDLAADSPPDLPADVSPDTAPDMAPDMAPDTAPDISPDTAPPSAGPLNHAFSKRFGAAGDDWGEGIGVDSSGNLYQAGHFLGTVDFGGGPLVSAGAEDIFVASYTSAGAFRWVKQIGSTGVDKIGLGLGVDGNGNVVVTGKFSGTVNPGGVPLVSAGGQDIIVISYDSNGNFNWARGIGGTGDDGGVGAAFDTAGNVFVTGDFRGTANFGGGPITSTGSPDFFVASYSAAGAFRWVKTGGSAAGGSNGHGLRVDGAGNVSVAGTFSGSVDFGNGPVPSGGNNALFAASYSSVGTFRWVRNIGGGASGNNECHSLAVDGTGNVFLTGYFTGTNDFGGGPLVSVGAGDIFIASYTQTGTFRFVRQFGTTAFEQGIGTAIDASGNLYVTGYSFGSLDFGGGPLPNAGQNDLFVASFTSMGAFRWAKNFGGSGADFGQQLVLDASFNLYVSGSFQGTVDFGGGPLTAAGTVGDVFLLKLSP